MVGGVGSNADGHARKWEFCFILPVHSFFLCCQDDWPWYPDTMSFSYLWLRVSCICMLSYPKLEFQCSLILHSDTLKAAEHTLSPWYSGYPNTTFNFVFECSLLSPLAFVQSSFPWATHVAPCWSGVGGGGSGCNRLVTLSGKLR